MGEKNNQEKEPKKAEATEPEALGWKVTDEEIDRVIRKLEEGWSF